ncbi:MAG: thioesterase family protein [Proteobacteria bacterium]|nr:thioesterase family protein [Pseudomonadota bacterium]MCP4922355.1 thioesterase family protein [Pseudomonadota bacterium]
MEEHLTWTRTDSHFTGVIPERWGQGRATYGGILGGVAARCLKALSGRPLRELSIGFIGPVAPGPARFEAELLREGRSVTHVSGRLVQGDRVMMTAHAVLADGRASTIDVPAERAPDRTSPDEAVAFGFIEGMTPEFSKHFDYRWTDGGWPFSGAKEAVVGGWCRFQRDEPMTDAHVLALVDAWPAPVLPMLRGVAPASSVTWTLVRTSTQLHASSADWCFYTASTDHAADGIAECRARLYRPDGELLAISRQLVAVFA